MHFTFRGVSMVNNHVPGGFAFDKPGNDRESLRKAHSNPSGAYYSSGELRQPFDMSAGGYFSPNAPQIFRPLIEDAGAKTATARGRR
jgi:hypothetical protein